MKDLGSRKPHPTKKMNPNSRHSLGQVLWYWGQESWRKWEWRRDCVAGWGAGEEVLIYFNYCSVLFHAPACQLEIMFMFWFRNQFVMLNVEHDPRGTARLCCDSYPLAIVRQTETASDVAGQRHLWGSSRSPSGSPAVVSVGFCRRGPRRSAAFVLIRSSRPSCRWGAWRLTAPRLWAAIISGRLSNGA